MALMQICPRCRNAYRLGEIRDHACVTCMIEITAEARQDDSKTALADDLVRGVASGNQREDLK